MVPLQIPGLPELLIAVFAFGFWLAVPAFVALVVYHSSLCNCPHTCSHGSVEQV